MEVKNLTEKTKTMLNLLIKNGNKLVQKGYDLNVSSSLVALEIYNVKEENVTYLVSIWYGAFLNEIDLQEKIKASLKELCSWEKWQNVIK